MLLEFSTWGVHIGNEEQLFFTGWAKAQLFSLFKFDKLKTISLSLFHINKWNNCFNEQIIQNDKTLKDRPIESKQEA